MSKLREVMDQKGVTIADIASETGLDPKTVWHATQGKKIHRATKIAIAGYFKVPQEELFLATNIQKAIQVSV
jgi:transcriptional regulator with XRE-family HTH domain